MQTTSHQTTNTIQSESPYRFFIHITECGYIVMDTETHKFSAVYHSIKDADMIADQMNAKCDPMVLAGWNA